jgi:hypothetical protein
MISCPRGRLGDPAVDVAAIEIRIGRSVRPLSPAGNPRRWRRASPRSVDMLAGRGGRRRERDTLSPGPEGQLRAQAAGERARFVDYRTSSSRSCPGSCCSGSRSRPPARRGRVRPSTWQVLGAVGGCVPQHNARRRPMSSALSRCEPSVSRRAGSGSPRDVALVAAVPFRQNGGVGGSQGVEPGASQRGRFARLHGTISAILVEAFGTVIRNRPSCLRS